MLVERSEASLSTADVPQHQSSIRTIQHILTNCK